MIVIDGATRVPVIREEKWQDLGLLPPDQLWTKETLGFLMNTLIPLYSVITNDFNNNIRNLCADKIYCDSFL